jgi:hypothetical protein
MQQSPIFIKSEETLLWIMNHTQRFPKSHRFVMAKRIEEAALSMHDQLVYATKTKRKHGALSEADYHLERLRVYNRMCMQLKLHSFKQYEYLASNLLEIGNLLGGWLQTIKYSQPSRQR